MSPAIASFLGFRLKPQKTRLFDLEWGDLPIPSYEDYLAGRADWCIQDTPPVPLLRVKLLPRRPWPVLPPIVYRKSWGRWGIRASTQEVLDKLSGLGLWR